MFKLNVLMSLPTLSLVTRRGVQTNVISSTLKALSLLPQRKIVYNMSYLSGPAGSSHSVHLCTDSSVSSTSPMKGKQDTTSRKTVKELLDVFETSKHSLDRVDLVTLLYRIARAVWHDDKQRQELQKLRGASQTGLNVFRDLLNHTADSIAASDDKHAANIIWSLDKIGETNHRLYKKFDKGKIVLINIK
ncbi:hypothetical protein OS493_012934 [Desmophyllum pertusum]|uniref:Uncharacterized protein n=1 Tax=Desmophyllum pertusum TaxID=174260 RepID=A0A9W9Z1H3_9CNID|nr:hypothetical protein OS493_012934 [Desmophyllum pertusum]